MKCRVWNTREPSKTILQGRWIQRCRSHATTWRGWRTADNIRKKLSHLRLVSKIWSPENPRKSWKHAFPIYFPIMFTVKFHNFGISLWPNHFSRTFSPPGWSSPGHRLFGKLLSGSPATTYGPGRLEQAQKTGKFAGLRLGLARLWWDMTSRKAPSIVGKFFVSCRIASIW